MSMSHTPEPWGWQQFGEWMLVGQHGHRPIVLQAVRKGMNGAAFRVRDPKNDIMAPFDPDHPDMQRIVACVNACAGLNPEALPRAVSAMRDMLSVFSPETGGQDRVWAEARSALNGLLAARPKEQ